MHKIVLLAGGTGQLGSKIIQHLIDRGISVRAIVRKETTVAKVKHLQDLGVAVYKTGLTDVATVALACEGVSCVVSALAGMSDVILDAQKILLDGAIAAKVPRFIPSDYSTDFTQFKPGENRNLDWRREFHTYLDRTTISATTIFNGAFLELITGQMPLILFKSKLVLYWGDPDHKMVFTSIKDTARYTAAAALDPLTPRFLRIAGDQKSPRELQQMVSEVTGQKFRLLRAGGPGLLGLLIKIGRTLAPAKKDLYPAWQGMQYMHNMIDIRSKLIQLDNDRYPHDHWTSAKDMITAFVQKQP